MGEVIHMPTPDNRNAARGRDGRPNGDASSSVAAQVEAQREDQRQRSRDLQAKLEKNAVLPHADQLEIATNVWRVMERAQSQGRTTKAKIMREAGIGGSDDSTKHLSQFAVNPQWPELRRKNARLNKKPRPYLNLVEAAAKLAGWDPDETVFEVFSEISLARVGPARLPNPAFEDLAKRLRDIGESVAVKHQLQTYFRSLSILKPDLGLRSDLVAKIETESVSKSTGLWEFLEFSNRPDVNQEFPIPLSKKSFECYHDNNASVPPYPTVVLGQWAVGCRFPVRILSKSWIDDSVGSDFKLRGVTEGKIQVEVRLCIVPHGPDMVPIMVVRLLALLQIYSLDVQTKPAISFEHRRNKIRSLDFKKKDFMEEELSCGGYIADHEPIGCRLELNKNDLPAAYSRYFDNIWITVGTCNFAHFFRVTAEVLEDWLGDDCDDRDWFAEPYQHHLLVLGPPILDNLYSYLDDTTSSLLPYGTPAMAVEGSILLRNNFNLVHMLDERSASLVALLDIACDEANSARDAEYQFLDQRLAAMRAVPRKTDQ